MARKPSQTEAITNSVSRRAALNSTANANEPASRVSQGIHSGRTDPALARGFQPSSQTTWLAATAPKVSFSSVVNAPAKRVVPEVNCRLASSDTAVVRVMPGISTMSAAITTLCKVSGSTVATAEASRVATNAARASCASPQDGRPSLKIVSQPISTPSTAAVARSAQPVFGSRPVTEAEARPKLKIASGFAYARGGRSSARMAASPLAMSRLPTTTSSAIASAAARRPRLVSPGSSRMTRVIVCGWPRSSSGKLRIMPVGFDQISTSRPSLRPTWVTAPSSRCDEVP